jgi:squalene-hopene/tetraprenyl-beta-curcumene cyclase
MVFKNLSNPLQAAVGCLVLLASLPIAPPFECFGQDLKQQARQDLDQFEAEAFESTVQRAVRYLMERGQAEDGSFSKNLGPAVTSMCVRSLLEHGIPLEHPQVQKGLRYLEATVQSDGGIYQTGSVLKNYETCVALVCFQRANRDGRYDQTIRNALAYLKGLQFNDLKGHDLNSDFFGGVSYDVIKKPDISNTSFFLEALEAAGEDGDSEAVQRALVFLARSQNLPSQYNTAPWAAKVSDEDLGGFIYSAAEGGESKAGATDAGGLRSYASMTYAGLKSFLYAGLSKDDVRVKAAVDWIRRNYSLSTNPGMGEQGLYYYYHVFAKALSNLKEPLFIDHQGVQHHWKNDLILQLQRIQNPDGSWTNKTDRWYEGDPNLVTSYALLALSYCKPD